MSHMPIFAAGLRALGVTLVEVGGWDGAFDYSNEDMLRRAADLLRAEGVRVYSYHPPFGGQYDFSVLDEGARANALSLTLQQLHSAAALGASYAVIHPSDSVPPADHLLRRRNSGHGLRQLARAAEDLGVILAIENLPPGYLAADVEELMWLVEGSESHAAQVCFDTGHANLQKAPISEWLRRINNKLATIHWHDNDGTADQHRLPGQGTIDWQDFFHALAEARWNRPICLEAAPPSQWPYAKFVRSTREALQARKPLV
jgi:sugar phosphate isomerase/epimerase